MQFSGNGIFVMKFTKWIKNSLSQYRKDTSGSLAAVWAISGLSIIMAVGAAYDVSQVSKAKQLAQIAADNMALTASVAVDFDNDDRFQENHSYPYTQLGGPSRDFTNSMVGRVEYDVTDTKDPKRDENGNIVLDEHGNPVYNKLIARATVTGTYHTAFMDIIGKKNISFKATSDVAYAAREGKPASIFFVTDNSGSMGSYDNNHVRKIDGLKYSMKSFMNILSTINSHGDNIFRTALFPYSSHLISNKIVNPDWGVLTNHEINRMYASGGTHSTTALGRAQSKFSLENNIHNNENGDDNPLKFLIFMSDGSNNGAYLNNVQVCQTEQVWVPGGQRHWVLHYYGTDYTYYRYYWWFVYYNVTYVPGGNGHYEDQEVCHYNTEWKSPENETSLAKCQAMKQNGVQIYSIAYNITDAGNNQDSNGDTLTDLAIKFMKDCSSNRKTDGTYSDDSYYQFAENGSDLQTVFDKIGQQVVKEVIRIKR